MIDLKQLVLGKRDEGKIVYRSHEGLMAVPVDQFIQQPADGILYDLNQLEEVVLTFIDDPKWINDFAVALTIRALKKDMDALRPIADEQLKLAEEEWAEEGSAADGEPFEEWLARRRPLLAALPERLKEAR